MIGLRTLFFILAATVSGTAQPAGDRWMLSGAVEIDRIGGEQFAGEDRQFDGLMSVRSAWFPGERVGVGLQTDFAFTQSSFQGPFTGERFWRTFLSLSPFLRYYLYQPDQSDVRIFLEGGGGYAWLRSGTDFETFDPAGSFLAALGGGFGWSPARGWALESSLFYHYYEKGLEPGLSSRTELIALGTSFRVFLDAETSRLSPEVPTGAFWVGGGIRLDQSLEGFLQVDLSPSLGWFVRDAFMGGGHLRLHRRSSDGSESLIWAVEPFGRYYFPLNDRWQIFPHIAAAYQRNRQRSDTAGEAGLENFIWRFGTGLNGFLTPAVSLEILTQYSISNLDLDSNLNLNTSQERRLGVRIALRYWLLPAG